jgi:hypothetical protein
LKELFTLLLVQNAEKASLEGIGGFFTLIVLFLFLVKELFIFTLLLKVLFLFIIKESFALLLIALFLFLVKE